MAKEYIGPIQVTVTELAKMNQAQLKMLEAVNAGSTSNLQSALNALSLTVGVIGLFLPGGLATVAGLVSATSGVIGSYEVNKTTLASMMQNGCNSMGSIVGEIIDLTKYDIFEIEFPFIEFTNPYVRYVSGIGQVVRAHVKGGGWVSW